MSKLENSLLTHRNALGVDAQLPGFESWSTKRNLILQQFTTNEKLTIVTSFLPGGLPLTSQISVIDKTAHRYLCLHFLTNVVFRLEQFDDSSGMKRLADLSQHDYVNTVNTMNQTLMSAWANDQRVESVKVSNELFDLTYKIGRNSIGKTTIVNKCSAILSESVRSRHRYSRHIRSSRV